MKYGLDWKAREILAGGAALASFFGTGLLPFPLPMLGRVAVAIGMYVATKMFVPKGRENHEISLRGGLTVADVEAEVEARRAQVSKIREYAKDIGDTELTKVSDEAARRLEGILDNLQEEPQDIANVGLSLKVVDPLVETMRLCARVSNSGRRGATYRQALAETRDMLEAAIHGFDARHDRLQQNDLMQLQAKARAVRSVLGPKPGRANTQ